MSRSRLVLVLIATITASMVFGGVAVAVAKHKTLSACTTKSHGVRELGTKVKCKKSEKKLTWRVTGRAGTDGKPGKAGAKGTQGPRGATGRLGKVRAVTGTPSRLLSPISGGVISASARCAVGEQVVGGGYRVTDTAEGQHDAVQQSLPFVDSAGQGWQVSMILVDANLGEFHGVTAYAMCAAAA